MEKIKKLIFQKQPFQFTYKSGSEKTQQFTVHYAQIIKIERHSFLCCWVEEEANTELNLISHNISLRLDRINELSIKTVEKQWRNSGMDWIEIEFYLFGSWVRSYEKKLDDISDILGENNTKHIRIIKRKVYFWHWTRRELLRYGKSCLVVAPDEFRALIASEIAQMHQNYQRLAS